MLVAVVACCCCLLFDDEVGVALRRPFMLPRRALSRAWSAGVLAQALTPTQDLTARRDDVRTSALRLSQGAKTSIQTKPFPLLGASSRSGANRQSAQDSSWLAGSRDVWCRELQTEDGTHGTEDSDPKRRREEEKRGSFLSSSIKRGRQEEKGMGNIQVGRPYPGRGVEGLDDIDADEHSFDLEHERPVEIEIIEGSEARAVRRGRARDDLDDDSSSSSSSSSDEDGDEEVRRGRRMMVVEEEEQESSDESSDEERPDENEDNPFERHVDGDAPRLRSSVSILVTPTVQCLVNLHKSSVCLVSAQQDRECKEQDDDDDDDDDCDDCGGDSLEAHQHDDPSSSSSSSPLCLERNFLEFTVDVLSPSQVTLFFGCRELNTKHSVQCVFSPLFPSLSPFAFARLELFLTTAKPRRRSHHGSDRSGNGFWKEDQSRCFRDRFQGLDFVSI